MMFFRVKRVLFLSFLHFFKWFLFIRTKLFSFRTPINQGSNYSPVFIVGSGRSGNTLLRRILNRNEALFIPPETYVLGRSIAQWTFLPFLGANRLKQKMAKNLIEHKEFSTFGIDCPQKLMNSINSPDNINLADSINAFYMHYADVHGITAQRWADKTPLNTYYIFQIMAVFPAAKFIHIKRDPYDTISSYMKSNLYNNLTEASFRWFDSINLLKSFAVDYPESIVEISYEDMVTAPTPTIKAVCDFIQVEFTPDMLEVDNNVENLGDVNSLKHHQNVKKPIDKSRIGQGKKSLSPQQINIIDRFLKKLS